MSIRKITETANPDKIDSNGSATVTLGFETLAGTTGQPSDIVFLVNTSARTAQYMKYIIPGAVSAVDGIISASAGNGNGIGGNNNVAVMTFSESASVIQPFTEFTDQIKNALQSITEASASGKANHFEAFRAAEKVLEKSANRKVIALISDGVNEIGEPADVIALQLRNKGIEIFCFGFVGVMENLGKWCSEPVVNHAFTTNSPDEYVTECFRYGKKLSVSKGCNGVRNVEIVETLTDSFEIVSVGTPTHGSAASLSAKTLKWTVDVAGRQGIEKPSLTFTIKHTGASSGALPVINLFEYKDTCGNSPSLPKLTLQVAENPDPAPDPKPDPDPKPGTPAEIYPEPCPPSAGILAGGCRDSVIADLPDTELLSLGRIVQLDVTVQNVCPGKRVAAAVILTETDSAGIEHNRGMKTFLIPPQAGTECQDITLRCINFVVPEELDVTGSPDSICNVRKFSARVMANYIDTDFICCDADAVIVTP